MPGKTSARLMVVFLALLQAGLSARLASTYTETDCPEDCVCAMLSGTQQRHSWRTAQSIKHPLWLTPGVAQGHTNTYETTSSLRDMICIGLDKMIAEVPKDVQKLVIYGGRYGQPNRQKDQPAIGHRDWFFDSGKADNSYTYVELEPTEPQLNEIDTRAFISAASLQELFIEGNTIHSLPTKAFSHLDKLRILSFKRNKLQSLAPDVLEGLYRLEKLDLSKNQLAFLGQLSFTELPRLKTLLLANNLLEELYESDFAHLKGLEELDLSRNRIHYFDLTTFHDLDNLRTLNMNYNGLQHLLSEWFMRNGNLTSLSLSNNELTLIEAHSFKRLTKLLFLNLSGNKLSYIDSDLFTSLKTLQHLDLSENNIVAVEDGTFKALRNLIVLKLDRNSIASLSQDIVEGLGNLKELYVEHNHLMEITNSALNRMPFLEKLFLSGNRIGRIVQQTFQGMMQLREIRLGSNRIKSIEESAFSVSILSTLSKIGWLFLDNNDISYVTSKTFSGMPYLRALSLSNNSLSDLHPNFLRNFRSLILLNLDHNNLTSLPSSLFQMQFNMKALNLAFNKLTHLHEDTFTGLSALSDLNMEQNSLFSLEEGSFLNLRALSHINLSRNRITSFHLDFFVMSKHLRDVNLSRNNLRELVPTSEDGTLKLRRLDISDNYISSIEENIMQSIGTGGEIYLLGNPWRCTCDLSWLPYRFSKSPHVFANEREVICKMPTQLIGRQIFGLSQAEFCDEPSILSQVTTYLPPATDHVRAIAEHPTPSAPDFRSSFPSETDFINHNAASVMWCDQKRQLNYTLGYKQLLLSWHATIVRRTSGIEHCAGVVLDANWVISSASCMQGTSDIVSAYSVIIGRRASQKRKPKRQNVREIQNIYINPQYKRDNSYDDLALIELAPTSNRNATMQVPCIMGKTALEISLRNYNLGIITATLQTNSTDILPSTGSIRVRNELCDADKLMCSRFMDVDNDLYNLIGVPVYVRTGEGRSDWGLAALNTQLTELGDKRKSLIRKHLPLYRHASWMERVIKRGVPTP